MASGILNIGMRMRGEIAGTLLEKCKSSISSGCRRKEIPHRAFTIVPKVNISVNGANVPVRTNEIFPFLVNWRKLQRSQIPQEHLAEGNIMKFLQ